MEFIGNNRRQCNSNSARPFEKGRPGLKVVSVPERTQVGDGAPRHRGRGQRCLEIPALPPPSLPLPEQQLAQGQAELQSPDRLPDLELVVQEPRPPPDSAAPRMGRGGGRRWRQQGLAAAGDGTSRFLLVSHPLRSSTCFLNLHLRNSGFHIFKIWSFFQQYALL